MVSIRRKILNKGEIIQEQLIRVLQKHEDAIGEIPTDYTTVEAVITYEDESTETVKFVIEDSE